VNIDILIKSFFRKLIITGQMAQMKEDQGLDLSKLHPKLSTEYESYEGYLGQGASGTVYKIRHKNGSIHAIKEVLVRSYNKADKEAIIKEASILGSLTHENIICFHGVHDLGEKICIAMEYAEGKFLISLRLTRKGGAWLIG
jgi:predicted Ser/Thr protein kinase